MEDFNHGFLVGFQAPPFQTDQIRRHQFLDIGQDICLNFFFVLFPFFRCSITFRFRVDCRQERVRAYNHFSSLGGRRPPDSNRSPFSLVTHNYPFTLNYYGDSSPAVGEHQHFIQCVGIINYADVFNRSVLVCVGLTGCRSMGSRILAEDGHLFGHGRLPEFQIGMDVGERSSIMLELISNQHIFMGWYCQ